MLNPRDKYEMTKDDLQPLYDLEEALTSCVRFSDHHTLWELLKKFPIVVTTPAGRLNYDPKEQKWRQVI